MDTIIPKTLNKRILLTGGGSGGHISPLVAVIAELQNRYTNASDQILYIGGNLGMDGEKSGKSMEQKLFKNSDINFKAIRAGKLQRYLSFSTFTNLFGVIGGFIDAYREIRRFNPDLVFSTGGYVTVPVCVVAGLMRIPVYIHEQTAALGLTNRITSKFAKKIMVTFDKSFDYLPKEKCVLTGNPVRPAIFINKPDSNWSNLLDKMTTIKQNQGKPIIFIMGGALGSHLFNELILNNLEQILKRYQLVLQMGSNEIFNDFQRAVSQKYILPRDLQDSFIPTEYITAENIGAAFAAADLYLARAGASSVYEAAVLNKKSIFVPIPWVTNNEQEKNARILEEYGIASVLLEKDFIYENLMKAIEISLSNKANEIDTTNLFPVDGAKRVVDELNL